MTVNKKEHDMSHQIIQPEGWAPAKGYANGVLSADGHLFVGVEGAFGKWGHHFEIRR